MGDTMYYINLFFLYSIFGHLLEKVLFPAHASGILYGFWTPVYGIGALIIILSGKYLTKKWHLSKVSGIIGIFLVGLILLSTIEWVGGFLIEQIFHITFWDYSDMKFSIGKYASLEMGLLWGFASLGLYYIVQPFLDKIVIKIPKWLTYSMICLFLIDLIATVLIRAK